MTFTFRLSVYFSPMLSLLIVFKLLFVFGLKKVFNYFECLISNDDDDDDDDDNDDNDSLILSVVLTFCLLIT